jgi:hypothetical protein
MVTQTSSLGNRGQDACATEENTPMRKFWWT